jgi:hypothetical protein
MRTKKVDEEVVKEKGRGSKRVSDEGREADGAEKREEKEKKEKKEKEGRKEGFLCMDRKQEEKRRTGRVKPW